ncbi:MAG: helix-turn-helix transcriptional regulator [Burkholderiales bacterium]
MRRADRLFQIVQALRGRRLSTAQYLAERLHVSSRTIYRDLQDLMLSGVPIEGEAGVGYRLKQGFDLPPLMFSLEEVRALVAGARMIESWGSPLLAQHARSALEKIAGILPAEKRIALERTRIFAPDFFIDQSANVWLDKIYDAIEQRYIAVLEYQDGKAQTSQRRIWPLGLYFWGSDEVKPRWTLTAWCESREDFRTFRVDRCKKIALPGERYPDMPGRRLEDWLKQIAKESCS